MYVVEVRNGHPKNYLQHRRRLTREVTVVDGAG